MPPTNPSPDSGTSNLPRHVAVIMDGNGRWASRRRLPRFAGHKAGVEAVRGAVRVCSEKGIEMLTLFAFSSENWRRPAEEVGMLMGLFMTALDQEVRKLNENNIRLRIIGDRTAFSQALQDRIADAEAMTKGNSGLSLNVAANFGGRWDVVQATRRLAYQVQRGQLHPDDITEEMVGERTELGSELEPDLFIRTGGEKRVSNFLLWHLAYTEFYFTDALWPDFDRTAFESAIASYASRQRRFGRTSEQVAKAQAY